MKTKSTRGRFVRETLSELDVRYDQAAVELICTVGIFAGDDPAVLDDLIAGLAGSRASRRIVAAQQLAMKSNDADKRVKAVLELEELYDAELEQVREAAYLLGIAVGRRLGPNGLKLAGGAR